MKKIYTIILTLLLLSCSSVNSKKKIELKPIITPVIIENIEIIENNENEIPILIKAFESINEEQNKTEILQEIAELKLVIDEKESAYKDFEKLNKMYKSQRAFLNGVMLPLALYSKESQRDEYKKNKIKHLNSSIARVFDSLYHFDKASYYFKKDLLFNGYSKYIIDKLYSLAYIQNDYYQMDELEILKSGYSYETNFAMPKEKFDSILKMPYMPFSSIIKLYSKEEFKNIVLNFVFVEAKDVKNISEIDLIKNLFKYLNKEIVDIRYNGKTNELDIVTKRATLKNEANYIKEAIVAVMEKVMNKENIKGSVFTK